MWISALVTLANLVLAGFVGVRLLWRARGAGSGPELWLAGYFLCGACLGSVLNVSVYGSLGDEGLELSEELGERMLAASTLLYAVAATCVYAFNWRTFRAGDRWALPMVAGAALVLAGTWLHRAATAGFGIVVVPGAAYWIERVAYSGAFVWAAAESLRYHAALRKRVRIGLAEPALANRFLLWGIWACATGALALSEVVARIAYVWKTGETQVVLVEQAMPIIVATVAATSLISAIAAATLWLTFFPTRRYLAWIASRPAPSGR